MAAGIKPTDILKVFLCQKCAIFLALTTFAAEKNIPIRFFCDAGDKVSISSTFYVQIFCTFVISAAFSSYILALEKNS